MYVSKDTRFGLSDEKSFAIGFDFAVECVGLIATKTIKQKREGIKASKIRNALPKGKPVVDFF